MNEYDPFTSPEPEEWLALDEQERVDVVEDYHRRKRIRLPSSTVHAIIHAVVENQIALGEQVLARVRVTADHA